MLVTWEGSNFSNYCLTLQHFFLHILCNAKKKYKCAHCEHERRGLIKSQDCTCPLIFLVSPFVTQSDSLPFISPVWEASVLA